MHICKHASANRERAAKAMLHPLNGVRVYPRTRNASTILMAGWTSSFTVPSWCPLGALHAGK